MLIEQYLPNISDPVYTVHQSFMWFLWLNWRKSTFYPVTAPNDSKCWPIVTSSIQELVASNCDVTMTDCSRVVAMEAFLAYFVTPVFQQGASLVYLKMRFFCWWWSRSWQCSVMYLPLFFMVVSQILGPCNDLSIRHITNCDISVVNDIIQTAADILPFYVTWWRHQMETFSA